VPKRSLSECMTVSDKIERTGFVRALPPEVLRGWSEMYAWWQETHASLVTYAHELGYRNVQRYYPSGFGKVPITSASLDELSRLLAHVPVWRKVYRQIMKRSGNF